MSARSAGMNTISSGSSSSNRAALLRRGQRHPPPPSTVPSAHSRWSPSVAPLGPESASGAGGGGVAQQHQPLLHRTSNNSDGVAEQGTLVAAMDVARHLYAEKLRGCMEAVMEALASELPQDHILIQLLADATTEQYCKVRLGEIVENFLYATQAQQYHDLAAALAQREVDALGLQQVIDELQRRLLAALDQDGGDGGATTPGGLNTSRNNMQGTSTNTKNNVNNRSSNHGANDDGGGGNPMGEEAARRELMAILEATSREQELERCRRALAAPMRLAAVALAGTGGDGGYDATAAAASTTTAEAPFEYVSSVLGELYRAMHAFMRYADGSLESLESLRSELATAESIIQNSPSNTTAGGDDGMNNSSLAGRSNTNANSSGLSTPLPNHGHNHRYPYSGTPRGGGGGFLPPPPAAAAAAAAMRASSIPERARIEELGDQLRDAQVLTTRAMDGLRRTATEQQRELARLRGELEAAHSRQRELEQQQQRKQQEEREKEEERHRRGSSTATAAEEGQRRLQARIDALLTENEDTAAALRADAGRAAADLQARLRATEEAAQAAERRATAATGETAALRAEVLSLRDGLIENNTAANNSARHSGAQSAALATGLRAELQLCRGDLAAADGELLCAQVEVCMSGLEALYHESEAAKQDLLLRTGCEATRRLLIASVATLREEKRHAVARLQMAEVAAHERDVTQRGCIEELSALLRAMWEEDSIAAALQLTVVGNNNAGFDGGGSHPVNASVHSDGATTDYHHQQQQQRLPTTLPGLAAALAYAHRAHRGRTAAWRDALAHSRGAVADRDSRLRVLEATEARLRGLLAAEQGHSLQLREEMDTVAEASPMRELLAKQDALLKAVSAERNALQKQWRSLNGDYIALERRNGALHERCTDKEYEMTRLRNGLLMYSSASSYSSSVSSSSSDALGRRRENGKAMDKGRDGAQPRRGSSKSRKKKSAIKNNTTPVAGLKAKSDDGRTPFAATAAGAAAAAFPDSLSPSPNTHDNLNYDDDNPNYDDDNPGSIGVTPVAAAPDRQQDRSYNMSGHGERRRQQQPHTARGTAAARGGTVTPPVFSSAGRGAGTTPGSADKRHPEPHRRRLHHDDDDHEDDYSDDFDAP